MISYDILISQITFFLVDLEGISQSFQLSGNQTIDLPKDYQQRAVTHQCV